MPSVLITGAARGIGRATAQRLAAHGWDVIAGVRSAEDGEALIQSGPGRISSVLLDITDETLLEALDEELPARLDAVVNNAGIVIGGPIEALPLEEVRRQLEVNVVGQVAVAQRVIPRLRTSRGRLVFVSSLSGRIATPMTGAYNASKFALEAVADALRLELSPWRIRVSLVEPAQTDTDLWRLAESDFETTVSSLSTAHQELYAKHLDGFRNGIPRLQRMAAPVDGVAATIERALTAGRPRARYVVGRSARAQVLMAQLMPTRVLDLGLRVGTGVPRRP